MTKKEQAVMREDEEALIDEMSDAFWGAYRAAPSGEGVMGAADFGCRAVVLVARGMRAPEAVAKAIGPVGNYGVPRRHALVPLEPTPEMLAAWYKIKNGFHYHGEQPPSDTSDVAAYLALLNAAQKPRE